MQCKAIVTSIELPRTTCTSVQHNEALLCRTNLKMDSGQVYLKKTQKFEGFIVSLQLSLDDLDRMTLISEIGGAMSMVCCVLILSLLCLLP